MSRRQDEFERVALPHTSALLGFARRLTGGTSSAEDLVQEALLLAWRSFHQFQPETNARAWLFRIVVNTWYGWNRRKKCTAALDIQPFANAHRALEIDEALDQLPEDQRAVILLAIVEGFTCREIAEILGRPIGTVMSRLARGRQTLKEKLGEKMTAGTR